MKLVLNWIKNRTLNFRLLSLLTIACSSIFAFGYFGFSVLKHIEQLYSEASTHLEKNYSYTLQINNHLSDLEKSYQILAAAKGVGGLAELPKLKALKEEVEAISLELIKHNNSQGWALKYVEKTNESIQALTESGKNMVIAFIQTQEDKANNHKQSVLSTIKEIKPSTRDVQSYFAGHSKDKMIEYFKEVRQYILYGLFSLIGIVLFLGLSINFFTKRQLSRVSSRMQEASSSSLSSANLIKQQLGNISDQANSQAASIQESSASLKEINSMVLQSSEHADHSAQSSAASADLAEDGQQVVRQMISSIGKIKEANQNIKQDVDKSNREFETITDIMSEIGEKTKVINEIVFQTKLLSFNASVEAARAGEHGRGFAVVAEEIGNLAVLSGESADEISGLLDKSITRVSSILEKSKQAINTSVVDSEKNVTEGVEIANRCEATLKDLVKNVSNVKVMMEQISLNSKEQAIGVTNISEAIIALEQSVQENSASLSQSNSGLESLLQEIHTVDDQANVVKALVFGIKSIGKDFTESSKASLFSKDQPKESFEVTASDENDWENEGFSDLDDFSDSSPEADQQDHKSFDELEDEDFDEGNISA